MVRLPNGLDVFAVNASETHYLFREIFGQRCYLAHGVTVPERGAVVDVGAHIGLASLFFHGERCGVPIWAVEPAPEPRACLERNVERHGVNATVLPVAVGARRGRATLTYYEDNTTMSGLHADPVADAATVGHYLSNAGLRGEEVSMLVPERYEHADVEVDVVPLSDVLAQVGERSIGLLKVDVERSELEVLGSLDEAGWQRVQQVVVEVHGHDHLDPLVNLLAAHEFQVRHQADALLEGTGMRTVFATRSVAARCER